MHRLHVILNLVYKIYIFSRYKSIIELNNLILLNVNFGNMLLYTFDLKILFLYFIIHSTHIFFVADPVHCNENPCKHGTCNDTVSPFYCKCKPGYTGIVCNQGILLKIFQNKKVWFKAYIFGRFKGVE